MQTVIWFLLIHVVMAWGEEALNKLREYYPNASKALDAIAKDMAEQIRR